MKIIIIMVTFNNQLTENITMGLRVRKPGLFKSSTNQIGSVARGYREALVNIHSSFIYFASTSFNCISSVNGLSEADDQLNPFYGFER